MTFQKIFNLARTISLLSYNTVLDLVMPPICAYCRTFLSERVVFCDECAACITPVVSQVVDVTATKKIKLFAVSQYKEPLRSLILAKNRADIISARQLGELIWDMTYIQNMEFDYIVPVPLHWTRFAKRGFNQAHEMAKVLSKKSDKPVVKLVKRVKRTEFQAALSRELRTQNVHDVFSLCCSHPQQFQGKRFLLVDDLMTTGSTLKAVARELYRLKPSTVIAAVACRVV